MASGKRKLTLYTNGKKVKEVSIQHEKKGGTLEEMDEETIRKLRRQFERNVKELAKRFT